MRKYHFFIFIPLILVIGFILGIVYKSPFIDSIKLNNQIDLLVLFEIIVTIIVAFYIANIFQKRNEENRVEKDFLIEKLKLVDVQLDSLMEYLKNEEIHLTEINFKIKMIHKTLSRCMNISEKISINLQETYTVKSNTIHRTIRDLATQTPRMNEMGVILYSNMIPLQINDGKITYSSERISDLEEKTEEYKFLIFQFIFDVNRA